MFTILLSVEICSIVVQLICQIKVANLRQQSYDIEIEQLDEFENYIRKWGVVKYLAAFAMVSITAIIAICYDQVPQWLEIVTIIASLLYLSWVQYEAME